MPIKLLRTGKVSAFWSNWNRSHIFILYFPIYSTAKVYERLIFYFFITQEILFFTEFVLEQENIFSLPCRIALEIKKAKKKSYLGTRLTFIIFLTKCTFLKKTSLSVFLPWVMNEAILLKAEWGHTICGFPSLIILRFIWGNKKELIKRLIKAVPPALMRWASKSSLKFWHSYKQCQCSHQCSATFGPVCLFKTFRNQNDLSVDFHSLLNFYHSYLDSKKIAIFSFK